MLESNINAARKFGLDTDLIRRRADTDKNIALLDDDLTFISVREKERTKQQ